MSLIAPFKKEQYEANEHLRSCDLSDNGRYVGADFQDGVLINCFYSDLEESLHELNKEVDPLKIPSFYLAQKYGHIKPLTPEILDEVINKQRRLLDEAMQIRSYLTSNNLWQETASEPPF